MNEPNGWRDREIERLGKAVERIEEMLHGMHGKLSALEVKSGTWGAIAGITVMVLAMIAKYFIGK